MKYNVYCCHSKHTVAFVSVLLFSSKHTNTVAFVLLFASKHTNIVAFVLLFSNKHTNTVEFVLLFSSKYTNTVEFVLLFSNKHTNTVEFVLLFLRNVVIASLHLHWTNVLEIYWMLRCALPLHHATILEMSAQNVVQWNHSSISNPHF